MIISFSLATQRRNPYSDTDILIHYTKYLMQLEQTLVILKPDAVGRTIVGEIITRFERVWLTLVAMKLIHATEEQLIGHYEWIGTLGTRRGKEVLDLVVKMMAQAPILAMVWEGVEAVEIARKLIGSTEPKSAAPGTIRGDYAHMSFGYLDANPGTDLYNIVHGSADLGEAKLEIAHWFKPDEIYSHHPLNKKFVR